MKVAKWGNSLAIRIPTEMAERLSFAEGEEVEATVLNGKLVVGKPPTIDELWNRVREIRGRIPAGYKFKRSDAYDDY